MLVLASKLLTVDINLTLCIENNVHFKRKC